MLILVLRLSSPHPLAGRVREGAPLAHVRQASPSLPSPACGGGSESHCLDYDVVRSNTPPEAFSLRASSAYSERTSLRWLSPVIASGIDTILRPLR